MQMAHCEIPIGCRILEISLRRKFSSSSVERMYSTQSFLHAFSERRKCVQPGRKFCFMSEKQSSLKEEEKTARTIFFRQK